MPKKTLLQKKYLIPEILILAVVILGIIFYPSPKSTGSKVLYVTSSDGNAKLTIPSTALPSGTKLEDIKISKIKYEESPVEKLDKSQIVGYSLKPDGLKFTEPVSISIKASMKENFMPILFHDVEDGKFENIKKTYVTINAGKKTVQVSGDITHFSDVVADFYGLFRIYIKEQGSEYYVNQSFPVTLTIEPAGRIWSGAKGRLTKGFAKGTTYDVNKVGYANQYTVSGILSPIGAVKIPTKTGLKENQKYEFKNNYSCFKEGSDSISAGPVEINYTAFYGSSSFSGNDDEMAVVTLFNSYKCKKAEGGFKKIDPPSIHIKAGVSH